jgi:Fe-S cluster biogenesis protein NfuA
LSEISDAWVLHKKSETFWGPYGGAMITKEKVEEVLGKIRTGLKSEGGDIELIEVKDDIVYVKLTGACGTCPMSSLTLKNWVESTMRNEIPEVKAVQAI